VSQLSRQNRPVGIAVVLALASLLAAGGAAEAAKWKPKLPPRSVEQGTSSEQGKPADQGRAADQSKSAEQGKSTSKSKAVDKTRTAGKTGKNGKALAGASGDSTGSELPTGALVSHGPGGEAIGKDCFVVKKRALVPGTGYMIRRSTFCN
jgi:hypothetical protein